MEFREFEHQVKLDHCPACLSTAIARHEAGEDFHYGIEGTFSTDRCETCGTIFVNPMPTVADLKALYPDDYYSYQPPVRPSFAKRLSNMVLRYPRKTHLPRFKAPGVMLDVGCGAGHYLLEMRDRGWKVYGSEISKGASVAARQVDLDIRPGELTESGFEPKTFDFIRSNHSFEHIPNPDEVLQEMRRLLKDDGKLFIGVPNAGGLFPKIFGVHWWNFGLPVHVINYTERGLAAILNRNGFSIEKVLHNSDYSGLTGSLQIRANAKAGIRRSDGKIYGSRLLRVPANLVAKATDLVRRGDCMEFIASKS